MPFLPAIEIRKVVVPTVAMHAIALRIHIAFEYNLPVGDVDDFSAVHAGDIDLEL